MRERRRDRASPLWAFCGVLAAGFFAACVFLPTETWIPRPQEIQIDEDLRRFLHPQIVDLLLAMDYGAALTRAIDCIRDGFGAEPGLAANNLGTLLSRMRI